MRTLQHMATVACAALDASPCVQGTPLPSPRVSVSLAALIGWSGTSLPAPAVELPNDPALIFLYLFAVAFPVVFLMLLILNHWQRGMQVVKWALNRIIGG